MRALVLLTACRAAASVSDAVAKLRATPYRCSVKGVEPNASFVVFTNQRSGSRWFVDTLSVKTGEHLRAGRGRLRTSKNVKEMSVREDTVGDAVFRAMAQDDSGVARCRSGEASKACGCALRKAFAGAYNTIRVRNKHYGEAPGFKYMVRPGDFAAGAACRAAKGSHTACANATEFVPASIVKAVCELRIPYVVYFRRNTLRRLVSRRAKDMAEMLAKQQSPGVAVRPISKWGTNNSAAAAHPKSAEAIAKLAALRPRLNASSLEAEIDLDLEERQRLIALLAHHCGDPDEVVRRVHFYEDLAESNRSAREREKDWAAVLKQVGAMAPGASVPPEPDTVAGKWKVIHGSRPVLDLVANPEEVEHALRATPHSWMLHC